MTLHSTPVPFGRRSGQTLDQVARTRRGLLFLDRQGDNAWAQEHHPEFVKAVADYLALPSVARELAEAVGR